MSPRILFRIFAFTEVVTWAGLIGALVLRASGVTDALVSPTGAVHGFIFLCYSVITVFVWVNQRWKFGVGAVGLLAAVIPFATLPFELVIDKKGLLRGHWRLLPGGETPKGFFEHGQAWVLKHPFWSIAIALVAVVVVFNVLLILGPPVPR
jgi:integral membrane protein